MCKIEVRGTCRGGVAEHAEGDGSDRGGTGRRKDRQVGKIWGRFLGGIRVLVS